MANYKTLEAWKSAMGLVKEIYLITKGYPKNELFGLTSQTKRAAVSVPSNIAEGLGRQYKKDTLQFLYISRGSLYEVETLLNIAFSVEIISQETFQLVISLQEKTLKILNGFINSYESRQDLK